MSILTTAWVPLMNVFGREILSAAAGVTRVPLVYACPAKTCATDGAGSVCKARTDPLALHTRCLCEFLVRPKLARPRQAHFWGLTAHHQKEVLPEP